MEATDSQPPLEAVQGALEHLEATRRSLAAAEREVSCQKLALPSVTVDSICASFYMP